MLENILMLILNVALIILGLTLLYQIVGIKLQKDHLKKEIDENIKFVLKPSKIWISNETKSNIIKLVNQKQSGNDIDNVNKNNKIVIKRMYTIYIICEILIILSIISLFIVGNNALQLIIKSFVLSLIVILTEFWFYRYIIYNTPVLDINTIYINLINKL